MTEGLWDKRSILPALGKILQRDIPFTKLKVIHNNLSRATREKLPEVRESDMFTINEG